MEPRCGAFFSPASCASPWYSHVYVQICWISQRFSVRLIFGHKDAGGPGTVLVKRTFFFYVVFATAKRTLNLAKFSLENLAKLAFRRDFWHFWSDTFSSPFTASVSASKWSFAGGEYVHSHIDIASIWYTGEHLCSLNTMNWEWSLWQQPMQHQLFQCGNWSSPCRGRQHITHEIQGTLTCPPNPTPSWAA